jgi:AmmeMemoRadiSam system protein A
MTDELTPNQRRLLLRLARTTLEERLDSSPAPPPPPTEGTLSEPRGAFVTLTVDGKLRGCIGHVVAVEPLWRSVRDNALSAALHDPRFPALTGDELPSVAIEISVLSPLRLVTSADEVEVGRHGLVIERGRRRGLLLPQVATDYGWDVPTFLDHTCRKAGLPPGAWQADDATVYTFTAEVFSEAGEGMI